jgi:Zn-dependent M28 family amino/carboxypeptidase
MTHSLFLILVSCVLALVPLSLRSQDLKVSSEADLLDDLKLGPCRNEERLDAVKKLFVRSGAADADVKVGKIDKNQNVIVVKKGKSDETVVIGAHYDKVSKGCGIIDNWSGVVILAHVLRTIAAADMQKTYVFAAFDREEKGMKGSAAWVKAIPKEKRTNYCSMINLDSFGLGNPMILENASSPAMVQFASGLGSTLGVPVTSVSVRRASSDSASFKKVGIPAITISALSASDPKKFMHSSKDKIENVLSGSVHRGYTFALEYIKRIDAGKCDMFR